jgi:hypothetical protein
MCTCSSQRTASASMESMQTLETLCALPRPPQMFLVCQFLLLCVTSICAVDFSVEVPECERMWATGRKRLNSTIERTHFLLSKFLQNRSVIATFFLSLKHDPEACSKDGLYSSLEKLQRELSLCEKSLADYLETKRLAFPRLYYVIYGLKFHPCLSSCKQRRYPLAYSPLCMTDIYIYMHL